MEVNPDHIGVRLYSLLCLCFALLAGKKTLNWFFFYLSWLWISRQNKAKYLNEPKRANICISKMERAHFRDFLSFSLFFHHLSSFFVIWVLWVGGEEKCKGEGEPPEIFCTIFFSRQLFASNLFTYQLPSLPSMMKSNVCPLGGA